MHLDEFMPVWDVRERFERTVKAPRDVVMRAAYEFDMQSNVLIRAIVNTRKLILGGTRDDRRPIGLVEETRKLGWGTLIEIPGELLICGAACQPWFGDVKFTPVPAGDFAEYDKADHVKIIWSLETEEIKPNVTIFAHEVRAIATDAEAKRKFMRYWRWARFGIVAIRLLLLPSIGRRAEKEFAEKGFRQD